MTDTGGLKSLANGPLSDTSVSGHGDEHLSMVVLGASLLLDPPQLPHATRVLPARLTSTHIAYPCMKGSSSLGTHRHLGQDTTKVGLHHRELFYRFQQKLFPVPVSQNIKCSGASLQCLKKKHH